MKTLILIIVSIFGVVSAGILQNHAVYKIKNKNDDGVLSLKDSDSDKVYLRIDVDSASQKWRAKKPTLLRSEWELKVTSDESNDLTVDDTLGSILALPTSGDRKYWHIRDAGEGEMQVKNYNTQTCLTSNGLNHPVSLSPCDNSLHQQWKFKEL